MSGDQKCPVIENLGASAMAATNNAASPAMSGPGDTAMDRVD
jgi:hypothetical protein